MVPQIRLKTVGQLIRDQRVARGLTQSELAARAGIDRIKMSRIERDHRLAPTPLELGRIADVLGVSVELHYAAARFPLPYRHMYPEPREFFRKLYNIAPTRKNLPEICDRVCDTYWAWLKGLGGYSQDSIDQETAQGLSNVPTPWPLSRAELICYEWFQLLDEHGLRDHDATSKH